MKVLVTGFDPFGGETVNPGYESVKLIHDTVKNAEIIKVEIPTVFGEAGKKVEKAIEEHHPDVVTLYRTSRKKSGYTGRKNCD